MAKVPATTKQQMELLEYAENNGVILLDLGTGEETYEELKAIVDEEIAEAKAEK